MNARNVSSVCALALMFFNCSGRDDSQARSNGEANTASEAEAKAAIPQFRILKTEAWGHRLERTLDVDVLVLDSNPSQPGLQQVARDAGENAYHSYEANGKEPLCNLMIRLHDKPSDDPANEVATYGTAHPVHPTFECAKKVPELWEWEYHTFTKQ